MNEQLKKLLFVAVPAIIIFLLVKPRPRDETGNDAAKKAANGERNMTEQKENATKILKEYIAAKRKGESATKLSFLNSEFQERYSLRVAPKTSDGYWHVMDTTGKEIFKAKEG